MKIITFQRLRIRIENEAGSVRKGVDKSTGQPWETTMAYPYGEIVGSIGVDGDPVDVFIGPNKSAKFAYVIHQLDKNIGHWDEDKCMLGFDDAMAAKEAYYKSYDKPDHFYGTVEAIPMETFKEKVRSGTAQMIHASMPHHLIMKPRSLGATIELYAKAARVNPFGVGDQVTVDGFHGRGMVVGIEKERCTVKFRSGEYISRDFMFVHNMADRSHKTWRT